MSSDHVIGAGVAGLSAALRIAESGRSVIVHEAAPAAGGRARSFFDEALGRTIDNGNHLMLTGNRSAMAFLEDTGALAAVDVAPAAVFPFQDLRTGERWTLRLGGGWLFQPACRVPGVGAMRHLSLIRLLVGGRQDTVARRLRRDGTLYDRFVEPLTVACLNAAPEDASADLMARVLAETVLRGEAACRPVVAREGLSAAVVDPAVARLKALGAQLAFGHRLRRIETSGDRLRRLVFDDGHVPLAEGDRVVLAVPPQEAARLVPGLTVPHGSSPIVNIHFALDGPLAPPFAGGFVGLIGGVAQWLFLRPGVASVTVSAAHALVDRPAEDIAAAAWPDVARALDLDLDGVAAPPARVVKEKRATFRQTPSQTARRPGAETGIRGLVLAGDWTATGLPATLDGAIRSGERAARLVTGRRARGP